MNEKLKKALYDLEQAWQTIQDNWDTALDNNEYPFEKSFDEYRIDRWIRQASK